MFATFRNAWKIADLRKRIIFTLLVLVIFRLGVALPVPFVDVNAIAAYISDQSAGILGWMDFMNGGALSSGSLFALSVQPYINASIIMQLLAVAIPALERLRKEGPEGERKFNRITRYVGAGLAAVLGFGYYLIIRNQNALAHPYFAGDDASLLGPAVFTAFIIVLCFIAGSVLIMWLGEQIDQKGIGNGISLLIFAGIISRWSTTVGTVGSYLEWAKERPTIYLWLVGIVLFLAASLVLVVVLNAAESRIKVQYGKKVVGRKMYGGQSNHIPIKVNMSGVMPIIFASAITSIPATIMSFFNIPEESAWHGILETLSSRGIGYAVIYTLLIIAFNYFYVAITYNPIEMANNIKKNNGAIPGIRPGKPTSDYISKIIRRVTLIGAIFLVVVAVGPIIMANLSGLNFQMGGTSLLIVVGVALDTSRSLESFMLMRHHKGFM